jgi:hypothetical protein
VGNESHPALFQCFSCVSEKVCVNEKKCKYSTKYSKQKYVFSIIEQSQPKDVKPKMRAQIRNWCKLARGIKAKRC